VKKLILVSFVVLLSLPIFAGTEEKTMHIERLKYGLCLKKWDRIFWGVKTKLPKHIAREIHERLVAVVGIAKAQNHVVDFEAIGKSLDQEYDAVIVHQCTILEQRMREIGRSGVVDINCKSLIDYGLCCMLGYSKKSSGRNFYNNACCFDDFYQSLTDEQLECLRKGTEASAVQAGWVDWLRDKLNGR
jgi:hypothetical protein